MKAIHEITSDLKGKDFMRTRVELFYRDFLEEAPSMRKDQLGEIWDQIKVIVWGFLYVEGLTNYVLHKIATKLIQSDRTMSRFWELIRQAKLRDKLNFIFEMYGITEEIRNKNGERKVLEMETLRNRLVHFKDVPTPVDLAPVVKKIGQNAPGHVLFDNLPDTDIVKELLKCGIEERRKAFLQFGEYLEKIKL